MSISSKTQNRFCIENKTVCADLHLLDEYGYETRYDGRTRGWRIIEREFDTQELQLLIDSVQASRFITQRQAKTLTDKLKAKASRFDRVLLDRRCYVPNRIRSKNDSIFYHLDDLHILIGLSINGSYDCIKMFFVNFWRIIKAKKLTKIQGGKITEGASPVVHARAGNMSFVIPIELEEEKFKYFVDKMFSSIDTQTIKETKYAFYENENIVFYTQDQIAEKAMREWQEKQRDK